jgi:hypothetical protein
MALYTIGVYYERQGETLREIVNRDWRMEYQQADQLAAEYTRDTPASAAATRP